ncbi:MAG: TrmH family RNA methyltransferase [Candidatus Pacebacteria bacterium]|nr:TrmH family RNA methyltransferase [Candidatus Paceibacterota bacterium]
MIKNKEEKFLILSDIRSAINVGAIFRTSDAVGIDKVYLVGCTPCPTDKFGRIQKDIKKSALGAEDFVPWEYQEKIIPLIKDLKKKGFEIIALEQAKESLDYRKYKKPKKVAIILGQEVSGVDKKVLKYCDKIIEIPMYGKKESLNVSVACGVALFKILRP